MIKTLRRRFIVTAMLSLSILLLIMVASITAASYAKSEQTSSKILEMLSVNPEPEQDPSFSGRDHPMFGYRVDPDSTSAMNHFTVIADNNLNIVDIILIREDTITRADAYEYAAEVLERDSIKGKIGSYKYLKTASENGGYKLVFLDNSIQARTLFDTLKASCIVALICIVLMFIIVLLVSRRAIEPIASNIEKQRQFVTDAGHEIKTPLAIIMANTDAMELNLGENKWSRNIRGQTLRLGGLMQQLLALAKMDEDSAVLSFEDVDLSRLVSESVLSFSELIGQKNIITNIAPDVTVHGNRGHLAELVSVLIDNAIKYSEDDGNISIALERIGKKAVLEIKNSCRSLPDVEPETLFDRFYRADSARTQKSGGYGVGLSVARAIAETHKGKIKAFYDDEHTIRFRIEI